MTKKYWIGDIFIDVSRNQITKNGSSETLAPKAIAVLNYLAENQMKVISQDELLNHVWQGTVVSANTLQRSIAQLRKALGDDSKLQKYIKTHAKKGYSLEVQVRWHVEDANNSGQSGPLNIDVETNDNVEGNDNSVAEIPFVGISSDASKRSQYKRNSTQIGVALLLMIAFAIIVFQLSPSNRAPKLNIEEVRTLTASDHREVAPIYSPDGKYIVFLRFSDEKCSNNVWAKRIDNQKEFQLTEGVNRFGAPSFSLDGKTLTFVKSNACEAPTSQKSCHNLLSLDFYKSLNRTQSPEVLLKCRSSSIRQPQWVNNYDISMLQQSSERWKLIRFSTKNNNSEVLYEVDDGNIIFYDYNPKDDVIAVIKLNNDNKQYLDLISPKGQLISSNPIEYPDAISKYKLILPKFSLFKNQLIFSTGQQLFSLSYDGQVTSLHLPVDDQIWFPVFHPNGKRILAVKGQYDSDLLLAPLSFEKNEEPHHGEDFIFQRSNKRDGNGRFQPNGNLIAFNSLRSGQNQVWLTDGEDLRMLTNLPKDADLNQILWAKDGSGLVLNVDGQLIRYKLDGSYNRIDFDFPIDKLFHWNSDEQMFLAMIRMNGVLHFATLNSKTNTVSVINTSHQVSWASKTSDREVIYTDQLGSFWLLGAVEPKIIKKLENQGSHKRFVVHKNKVYGINNDNKLWSYGLDSQQFNFLGQFSKKIDYLSDVSDTQALMVQQVTGSKEVVEILLSDN